MSDEEVSPPTVEPVIRGSPSGPRPAVSIGGFAQSRIGAIAIGSTDARPPEEKKPLSIGDIAERIQQQNAMLLASEMDRLHQQKQEEERARKRHHKKEKRRRRTGSYSSDDGPHSPHRKHVRYLEGEDVLRGSSTFDAVNVFFKYIIQHFYLFN